MGFTVPDEKSVLQPTKTLKYLGFILNSEKMTVTLSPEKAVGIQMTCIDLENRRVILLDSSGNCENGCSVSWSKVGPTANRMLGTLTSFVVVFQRKQKAR